MNQQPPQTLQQFIDNQKTQYVAGKSMQASNEYMVITTPYIKHIIELEKRVAELEKKQSKKERVKIVKKGKK